MRERIEYASVCILIKLLGYLPRRLARNLCGHLATIISYLPWKKKPLQTACTTLKIAFPAWNDHQQREVMKKSIRHLGWMLAEMAHFPAYDRGNIEQSVVFEGLENFAAAAARGKGVLILTGHFSAFELFPLALGLSGFPLHFLVRSMNNSLINRLINQYRSLSKSVPIDKNQSAKQVLNILRKGGSVGITIDQNTSSSEGIFVNFFNKPACTTTGLARFALKTEAAVIPGFLFWDEELKKYRLRLDPLLDIVRTGDKTSDIRENTARFTELIEQNVRAYPEQWTMWVHKRWKTRPSEEMSSCETV